jgi:CheY-like chemotaxis protein
MTKNRILYAEDDEIVRNALTQILVHLGWEVTAVANGAAALSDRDLADVEVVLTDHHMPGMDGLKLVEELRGRGYAGRIYVISGALTALDEARYRALRVDGIANKPITLRELRGLLGAARRLVA